MTYSNFEIKIKNYLEYNLGVDSRTAYRWCRKLRNEDMLEDMKWTKDIHWFLDKGSEGNYILRIGSDK